MKRLYEQRMFRRQKDEMELAFERMERRFKTTKPKTKPKKLKKAS